MSRNQLSATNLSVLHFDLSQGCTARALCASLLDLGASPDGDLSPISAALLQKSTRFLTEAGYILSEQDTRELTNFCILLTNLDPKAISSTRIPLSFDPQNFNRDVLLKLSESVPIYEQEWPAPSCDATGLALLKTCVSHFGARGESTLLKMGFSFSPEVRALWCEASFSGQPRISHLVQISAFVPDANLLGELTHRLNQIGAKKLWTTGIQDQGTLLKTQITVISSESEQNKIIEALLILGQAPDIQSHIIEQHTLQKRTVSVTLGRTQKLQVCRVIEFLWGDKILRADPLPEDLAALAKSTGHSQEIVRADVLSAWKNRGS